MCTLLRNVLAGCCALTLWAYLPVLVHAQVLLEQRLPMAGSGHEQMEISTKQTLTIGGQPIDVSSTRFSVMSVTVSEPDANGQVTAESAMDALNVRITLPGGLQLQYDSGGETAPQAGNAELQPVMDALHSLSKSSWTTIYGSDGRVSEVRGAGPAYADAAAANPLLQDTLDPDYMVQQANANRERIPAAPVQMGDTWQRSFEMRLEGGQVLSFDVEYEYRGEQQRDGRTLDEIGLTYTAVRYSMMAGASPLTIKSSELQIADSSGTLLFDRALGAVVNDDQQVHITGTLKLAVNGMDLDGTLDLTMSMRTTVGP